MLAKISQLLETIKETLEKASKEKKAANPLKRVTYRLKSNIQNKDVLSNRDNSVIAPSNVKGIIRPRGDGRITGVPVNEHSMIRSDPAAVRSRQNVVQNKKEAEMDKLRSPKQNKKIRQSNENFKNPGTTKTHSVLTADPGIPKITPEQSHPKKLGKMEPPAPVSAGDYKNIDPNGKKYGDNYLEEDKKKPKKKIKYFFRKNLPNSTITLAKIDGGDLELEVVGDLPLKIESAIKSMGFIPVE
jgi:hypothetical protein